MGQKYLIDSNVIIDYTNNNLSKNGLDFIENIIDNDFNLSIITKIEVLGFNEVPNKLFLLKQLLDLANMLFIEDSIANKSIELRKEHKLKLGDAIIGATAMINNSILVTRNEKDFIKIKGIQLLNPFSIQ
jgi:predicted nucleic acid-binding protein